MAGAGRSGAAGPRRGGGQREAALQELHDRHAAELWRFAMRLPHDRQLSEDEELSASRRTDLKNALRQLEKRQGQDAAASLEAELFDGTEGVTLIWLGRRRIPGIEPGRTMRVRGRLAVREGRKVLYNPYYEICQAQ